MTDRVAVMRHGNIERVGDPASLYVNTGDGFRCRFHRRDEFCETSCR